jgi:general nucleoside transport system ATP-binding protein
MNHSPFLHLQGITKKFPGVLANDGVTLEIQRGEVHALLGENGAGKSTLMKVLYGFYRADSGEIILNGKPIQILSPQDARKFRIGMVFQDFLQIPALSVAENIALFLPDLPAILDKSGLIRRIEKLSEKYDLQVDPSAPLWQLSIGERQKVELLKLILADAQVLIFDEPTRSLAPHEIDGLFRVFANLRRDGFALVFITHKLPEVMVSADRITVMRRGQIVGTLPRAEATEDGLVSLMFREEKIAPRSQDKKARKETSSPVLELIGVSTRREGLMTSLQDISLKILPGEIVGVAGVSGNGQRELGDLILGLEPCLNGRKFLWGKDATHWSVARIRESGVAFIPEDPIQMAAFSWLTVQENMAIGHLAKYSRKKGLAIDWKMVRDDLSRSLQRLGFQIPSFFAPVGILSGGNVQRVTLAREMAYDPRFIVAFYPTRGLDVKSAAAAREIFVSSRNSGAGVLLISEDLDELFDLSDRLVVLFRGQIAGIGSPGETSVKEVGYLMTGMREDQKT